MTTLRKGQVRLGPRTWGIIREAYLSGASAASLAETYGCSLGTIRYRAVREGWRRCDAWGGEAALPPSGAEDEEETAPSPDELFEFAVTAAGRALRAGRPSEAAIYMRVAEAARRVAGAEEAEPAPEPAADRARREAVAEEMRRKIARRIEHILEEERQAAARGESDKGWVAQQLGRARR